MIWHLPISLTVSQNSPHSLIFSNVCAQSLLCTTFCNTRDCSPPGSSVHGISQARTLEWVIISYSRGSSQPRDQTGVSFVSCIGRWIPYHCATLEAHFILAFFYPSNTCSRQRSFTRYSFFLKFSLHWSYIAAFSHLDYRSYFIRKDSPDYPTVRNHPVFITFSYFHPLYSVHY